MGRCSGELVWPLGADADHLKTQADVDATAAAGFTFFTIDPSDHVDPHADDDSESTLREKFAKMAEQVTWFSDYEGVIRLSTGTLIHFTEEARLRAAVKYGRAISAAIEMANHIRRVHERNGRDYEIELSVDETAHPTTLQEHFIIASECLKHGMKMVSLAPRFIGDFEKGIDYKGDLSALEKSFADHAAIAEMLGPYKLGLHSGSDKLSIYAMFARATRGRFHVKTSGTSYLEALRVVARQDPSLFRQIIRLSRLRYDSERATYHVSATLDSVPTAEDVSDNTQLERIYLGSWRDVPAGCGFTAGGRQILHCTYGSVLTDRELRPAIDSVLKSHEATYYEVLSQHFTKHLEALHAGM